MNENMGKDRNGSLPKNSDELKPHLTRNRNQNPGPNLNANIQSPKATAKATKGKEQANPENFCSFLQIYGGSQHSHLSFQKILNLDAYYKRKMEKENKNVIKKVLNTERTVFNDEEQRRQELLLAREKQKEEQIESLKRAMQGGMAQAMKEQAQLREEMAYQYKIGNFEAAAAIQKRLDPDVAM